MSLFKILQFCVLGAQGHFRIVVAGVGVTFCLGPSGRCSCFGQAFFPRRRGSFYLRTHTKFHRSRFPCAFAGSTHSRSARAASQFLPLHLSAQNGGHPAALKEEQPPGPRAEEIAGWLQANAPNTQLRISPDQPILGHTQYGLEERSI